MSMSYSKLITPHYLCGERGATLPEAALLAGLVICAIIPALSSFSQVSDNFKIAAVAVGGGSEETHRVCGNQTAQCEITGTPR